MEIIHDKAPRETVGRDTTNRFRMQFQAAAFAALEILSGKEIDRVYCDYHDDFVVRHNVNGLVDYHFFQVKTKGKLNKQWKAEEILSFKKRDKLDRDDIIKAIRTSIVGKLFVHTVEFDDQCREITLLSNVHFNDDALEVESHLKVGISSQKYITNFIEKFSDIFSAATPLTEKQAKTAMAKLSLMQVSYMGETLESFTNAARHAIWTYSEIDLQKTEIDKIAISLVELVQSKSCAPISGLNKIDIDRVTSIGLDDLLKVLSISTQLHRTLQDGGDPAAIKVASILQRRLKAAGASDGMIEFASVVKVSWDVWLRTNRHSMSEYKLQLLLSDIDKKCQEWTLSGSELSHLEAKVKEVLNTANAQQFNTLDLNLLIGAFFASIVRRDSI